MIYASTQVCKVGEAHTLGVTGHVGVSAVRCLLYVCGSFRAVLPLCLAALPERDIVV